MGLGSLGKAVATGGLSLLSGGGGGSNIDTEAYNRALGQSQQDLSPYTTGGASAQNQLMAQMGLGGNTPAYDVTQLPGYQNAMKQGLLGVQNQYAGTGLGANQMMALQQKGQNIFGDYYSNYMNRLSGMSQQGLGATQSLNQLRFGAASGTTGLQQQQAAQKGAMMQDVLGLAGTVGGMMVGGPMGAGVGSQLGQMAGGGAQPAAQFSPWQRAPAPSAAGIQFGSGQGGF